MAAANYRISSNTSPAFLTPGGAVAIDFATLSNVGPTGATGPVGATGPTGTFVPSAYGFAGGNDTATLTGDGDVWFNLGGAQFPNFGFTAVPASGGNVFEIQTTGAYEIEWDVIGTTAGMGGIELKFSLYKNGAPLTVGGSPMVFGGNVNTSAVELCHGHAIVALNAGDEITLHNVTATGTVDVDVEQTPELSINRGLSLIQLN